MNGLDIFDFYRWLLAIVVGVYTVVHLANFVWRWQLATLRADKPEAVLRLVIGWILFQLTQRSGDLWPAIGRATQGLGQFFSGESALFSKRFAIFL